MNFYCYYCTDYMKNRSSAVEMDDRGHNIHIRHSAVICANTVEAIEVPFGFWARMGPRNDVFDGVPGLPFEGAILVDRGAHCKL